MSRYMVRKLPLFIANIGIHGCSWNGLLIEPTPFFTVLPPEYMRSILYELSYYCTLPFTSYISFPIPMVM